MPQIPNPYNLNVKISGSESLKSIREISVMIDELSSLAGIGKKEKASSISTEIKQKLNALISYA